MTPEPTFNCIVPHVPALAVLHQLSHVVKEVVHLKFISILVCAGFAQALSAASRDGDSVECWLLPWLLLWSTGF